MTGSIETNGELKFISNPYRIFIGLFQEQIWNFPRALYKRRNLNRWEFKSEILTKMIPILRNVSKFTRENLTLENEGINTVCPGCYAANLSGMFFWRACNVKHSISLRGHTIFQLCAPIFVYLNHMWLVGLLNPCELLYSWEYIFL